MDGKPRMKRTIFAILPGLAAMAGVAVALASGEIGNPPDEPADDGVVLGEEDLTERAEIRRNMYRRITPSDLPLVQDVGTWPAAWEEFGPNWNGAAVERKYGAWVVPVEVEQTNGATVIRDGTGLELWRSTTDFTRPESAGVILTGGLVAEEDWARYEGVRGAVEEMTADAFRNELPSRMNPAPTSGLRFTSCEWTPSNTWWMALAYEEDTNVDLFVYAVDHTSASVEATWTNDENMVITDTTTVWYPVGEPFDGRDSTWEYLDTVAIDNGEAEYADSGFPDNLGRARFYAAAVVEDTDGDGLSDGFEDFVTHTDADNDDSDGDGLGDGFEFLDSHTDPNDDDSDHDGIDDPTELAAGTNPSGSNVWWVTKTTNVWVGYGHEYLGNQPSWPDFPIWKTDLTVMGEPPVTNAVPMGVTLWGLVDDAIQVDGQPVPETWTNGAVGLSGADVTGLVADLTSKSFQIDLYDWPDLPNGGDNEIRLGTTNEPFQVEWEWKVPVQLTIDVASSVSGESPNPPPFEGFRPWPFSLTNSQPPDKHFVVFFKDAMHFDANTNFVTNDFDIVLSAAVTPASFPVGDCSPHWYKISGPESGMLLNTDTFVACFRNPRKGGVYRLAFDLGWPGAPVSEATVFLPLAGAEVDAVITNDMRLADEFAAKVRSKYRWYDRNRPANGARWFFDFGAGDYRGRVNGLLSQTDWHYNWLTSSGLTGVATWKGCPVKTAKMSNFLVAYGARKIGVLGVAAWWAQRHGTPNDSSAQKSWNAGWAVGGGADYNAVVGNMVKDIWDEADEKNRLFWPNTESASNHVDEQTWEIYSLPDYLFTSPGFVYMEDP